MQTLTKSWAYESQSQPESSVSLLDPPFDFELEVVVSEELLQGGLCVPFRRDVPERVEVQQAGYLFII